MVLDLVQWYRVRYFALVILHFEIQLNTWNSGASWLYRRNLWLEILPLSTLFSQISRKGNAKKGSPSRGKPMTSQLYSTGQWTLEKTWKWRRKRRSLNRRISGSADTKCKRHFISYLTLVTRVLWLFGKRMFAKRDVKRAANQKIHFFRFSQSLSRRSTKFSQKKCLSQCFFVF